MDPLSGSSLSILEDGGGLPLVLDRLAGKADGRQKGQEGEEHAQEGPRRDGSIGVAFVYIRNLAVFRTVSYLHLS